ncbi:cyclophilin-like family protein [Kitasatospora sp. NPDC088346]|uniref:cyclophilin-like family protein n=1 Tax=Kitasatospora sp. NPDC088346 TaxID=3364073 RepID=UPI0038256529
MRATPTSEAVRAALPMSSSANTWGEEAYFGAPVSVPAEAGARQVVGPGTVAFRTDAGQPGASVRAHTDLSGDGGCRPASPCNVLTDVLPNVLTNVLRTVLGELEGDAEVLGTVRDDDPIRAERA